MISLHKPRKNRAGQCLPHSALYCSDIAVLPNQGWAHSMIGRCRKETHSPANLSQGATHQRRAQAHVRAHRADSLLYWRVRFGCCHALKAYLMPWVTRATYMLPQPCYLRDWRSAMNSCISRQLQCTADGVQGRVAEHQPSFASVLAYCRTIKEAECSAGKQ